MTHLRQLMLGELERRNYSKATIRAYVQAIRDFAAYFKRPPDQLGPEHVREYQVYLLRERKLSPNTVNTRTGALRFFFVTTLKRPWTAAETPYPKRAFELPTILTREEVAQLIDSARNPLYRTILSMLYATGMRRAELSRLKISDIDSARMVIHAEGGKGRKDRDVMLGATLLETCVVTGAGCAASPKSGSSPVACGIHRVSTFTTKSCGTLSKMLLNEPA